MKITVHCADKYEAKKLAAMLYAEEDSEAQIAEIINVIGEECVVLLRDHSVHSILLTDKENATLFADFVQSVKDGEHRIRGGKADGEMVTVEKS